MRDIMRCAILSAPLGDLTVSQLVKWSCAGAPIALGSGTAPPTMIGEGGYHTTLAKRYCAYTQKGRTVYHASTRAATVGIDWIAEQIRRRVEYRKIIDPTRRGALYILCGSARYVHGIRVQDAISPRYGRSLLVTAGDRSYACRAGNDRHAVRQALAAWTRRPRTARELADPYLHR